MTEAEHDDMTEKMLDQLRSAIFKAYEWHASNNPQNLSDQLRHELALHHIFDETLEGHKLSDFSAAHLETLSLCFAYWRECEVEGAVRAPEPTAAA